MKTDTSIYTHYEKIKRCIASCETMDQITVCYNMANNLFNVHIHNPILINIISELYELIKLKRNETKHI